MILRAFLFLALTSIALPSNAKVYTCANLFERTSSARDELKIFLLYDALSETQIKLTEDQEQIAKVMENWDLDNSTPAKVEEIAQALVLKPEQKRSFLQWLKGLAIKGENFKQALRVRAETLLLKRELLRVLKARGFEQPATMLEKYKDFRNTHYNKIQLTKFIAINSLLIHYIGTPLYFPNFNWVDHINFKDEELDMLQEDGFRYSRAILVDNHKQELFAHNMIEHAPQIFILGVASQLFYNYVKFEASESKYDVTVDEIIPQSDPLYIEWQRNFEARTGRKPDLKNPEDRKDRDDILLPIYRAWVDIFSAKNGRPPDLSQKKDHLAWTEFLSSHRSPQGQ